MSPWGIPPDSRRFAHPSGRPCTFTRSTRRQPIPSSDEPSEDGDDGFERIRFLGAEIEHAPGSELRVRVRLAVRGSEFVGKKRGAGAGVVELRMAAEATLAALEKAVPEGPRLQLAGVKSVHAFDADAVMVSLRVDGPDGKSLLGCVPVGASPGRAAATATLDAVNRILGRPEEPDD